SRNFTVFFDWDKTDLSADAKTVLDNAAKDAGTGHITKINVTGYTDRSGTDAYNLKLSMRRAEAVKAYLTSKGVGASIATDGKGESDPLVPTADGVREPSNRRAVIIFP
ncbi:OmpA family protein, partial [Nitrospirillum viridazoti]